MARMKVSRQKVGVGVTAEQHDLEKEQAGAPDRGGPPEPGENVLADQRLDLKDQEGAGEDGDAKRHWRGNGPAQGRYGDSANRVAVAVRIGQRRGGHGVTNGRVCRLSRLGAKAVIATRSGPSTLACVRRVWRFRLKICRAIRGGISGKLEILGMDCAICVNGKTVVHESGVHHGFRNRW